MDLETHIKEIKPNISDSSLKVYIANLKILHNLVKGNKDIKNLNFLLNFDKIIDLIKDKSINTQKNYIVAVVNALAEDEDYEKVRKKYFDKMLELQNTVIDIYDNQEKSEKQEKNWIDYEGILKLLKKLRMIIKPLLEKPPIKLKLQEKILIQQVLLLYLYSGKAFPPLRNDFDNMKVYRKDPKKTDENYLVLNATNSYFVLNKFKTDKRGQQTIKFSDKMLKKLINDWLNITKSDFLLVNASENTPITPNGISKNLLKLFQAYTDKSVSNSLLRSIYISHMYNNENLSLKEKKQLGKDMLHSNKMAETVYQKID
jgi:hypothetical protein